MTQIEAIIPQFNRLRVLVIGELMLDVYLYGVSERICREAPVPVVDVHQREDVPGGAANAAINLAMMGAHTTFLTVAGDDREAGLVLATLRERGVNVDGVIADPARATLTKKRVVSGDQLLVRYDYGTTDVVSPEIEARLIDNLREAWGGIDAVLVSDYGYGILTDGVLAALGDLLNTAPRLLVVDSKHLARYHDLHPAIVKPNYGEALKLLSLSEAPARVEQMIEHGQAILDITGAGAAAVTVDRDGAVIFERGKAPYRTYAKPMPDSKAAGAGDTYVSALTLALSAGAATLDAAEVAAAAARVVLRKDGTAVCTAEELLNAFTPPQKVIEDRTELAARVRAYREQGRRIVFTNGCFDILHRGHITYLTQASAFGDVLIVGVNSDDGVRRLKGADRPVNVLEDRMHILAALDCVDHVVSFAEPTSEALIGIIQPEVFVKGGDHTRATLPEAPLVEALGGAVEIVPYVIERSTTAVIGKIRHSTARTAARSVSGD